MASNILKASKKVEQLTELFIKHADAIQKDVEALVKLNAQYAKLPSDYIKSQKEIIDLDIKRARLAKALTDKVAASSRKQTAASNAVSAAIRARNVEAGKTKKITSTNIAQFKSLNSAYQQQSRLLIDLRQRMSDLNIKRELGAKLSREETKELRRLTRETRKLDRALKKVDAAAGKFARNVGNYPRLFRNAASAVRSFAGAFGFAGGIFLLAGAIRSVIGTFATFQQGQADLAAILGKNVKDIKALTRQAKLLGATTAFTATQIAKLQLELSKLGFTEKQIIKSTLAIENLAIATGVDAARAAKLAGAALRGFNLDAEEMDRVVSTLAVSTTKSANAFDTLEVALPKVAAIAKSFGFTIEDTTALLGGLQNAGFEASIAGTSLRQIFVQLADSNGKLAKRLGGGAKNFDELIDQFIKLERSGISLSEAFNLTNTRSAAAFKTFLAGAEDMRTLRNGITDVNEELQILAETKLDTLKGDVILLTSAWEGLVLAIEDGNGAIATFFREAIQNLTSFLEGLRLLNTSVEEQGKDAAVAIIDAFKGSAKAASVEVKNFIIETMQEAETNIDILRARLKELTADPLLKEKDGKIVDVSGQLILFGIKEKARKQAQGILDDLTKEIAIRDELTQQLNVEQNRREELIKSAVTLSVEHGIITDREINIANQLKFFRGQATLTVERGIKTLKAAIEAQKKLNEAQAGGVVDTAKLIRRYNQLAKSINRTALETIELNELWRQLRGESDKLNDRLEFVGVNLGSINEQMKKAAASAKKFREALKGTALSPEAGGVPDAETPEGGTVQFGVEALEVPDTDQITAELQKIIDKYAQVSEAAVLSSDRQREIFTDLFRTFSQLYDIDLDAFMGLFEGKLATTDDFIEAAAESLRFLLTITQETYQADIEGNKARLDAVLGDDKASKKQKEAAQKIFDKKEKEIKTKKAKQDRDNALIQIAIDTAVGIAKTFATLGFPAGIVGAAVILALGIAQAAFVASQPLPKFEDGTDSAPQGWAWTQEKRAEPILDKHGRLKTMGTSGGAKLTYLEKGDKVLPSRTAFFNEDITRAAMMTTINSQDQQMTRAAAAIVFDFHYQSIKKDVKDGIKEGLKGFKSTNNTSFHVDLGHELSLRNKGY